MISRLLINLKTLLIIKKALKMIVWGLEPKCKNVSKLYRLKIKITKMRNIAVTKEEESVVIIIIIVVTVITSIIALVCVVVVIDANLHFHDHVNFIFSRCVKLLGLVRSITFNFSSLECLLRLYITLVRSKMEYASIVWNSIMSTDSNKLECIQQRFVAFCFFT
jgi:hypothetical protein